MLILGYCFYIRSECRLCEEVHLNLAYRWFCRLGLDGEVPDHSMFSKNRQGRFRDSDVLRRLFEQTVARKIETKSNQVDQIVPCAEIDDGIEAVAVVSGELERIIP